MFPGSSISIRALERVVTRSTFAHSDVAVLATALVARGVTTFNTLLTTPISRSQEHLLATAVVPATDAPAPAGNVLSGVEPTAPVRPRVHVVLPGETLRSIAKEYYGNEMFWPILGHVGDPDVVHPGERLVLDSTLLVS